ncbi:hypothetical protein Dimus_032778 [Dionaea muscipula]
MKERNTNQGLICFYDVLRCIGESWIEDKKKRDVFKRNIGNTPPHELVEVVVAMLDCINKAARERFDLMDEDEPKAERYGSRSIPIERKSADCNLDNRTPLSSSPQTPTSVLPELPRFGEFGNFPYSPPRLWGLRVQAVEKLSTLDLKRLTLHMMPHLVEERKVELDRRVSDAKVIAPDITEKSKDCMEEGKLKLKKYDPTKGVNDDGRDRNSRKDCEQATPMEDIPVNIETEVEGAGRVTTEIWSSKDKTIEEIQQTTPDSPPPASALAPTPVPMPAPALMAAPLPAQAQVSAPSPEASVKETSSSSLTFPSHEVFPSSTPSSQSPPSMTKKQPVLAPIKTLRPIRCAPPPPPPPPSNLSPTPSQPPVAPPLPPPPPPPSPASNIKSTQLQPPPLLNPPSPPILPDTTSPTLALPITGPPPPPRGPAAPTLPLLSTGPPPPPLPPGTTHPPPPPPIMNSKGSMPVPPPPMPMKGGAPPPPPLGGARSLRAKATTKLKRSSHMGNLYRLLKGKVEGSVSNGKSSQGKKSVGSNSSSGKQSMADALAEMTKRSAYFLQIEDDVQKHGQIIKELHAAINSFQTKDMDELLKFHRHVESHLEVLTDESQVLSRFEGFPVKKLEALRMATALYTKLNGIVSDLQNWKIESPLGQLLDRVEKYFNKIKEEMDALERTKDEESKKFQSHNIHFDFHILVKIKEAMVDVSSSCMELALRERREAKAESNDQTWFKAGGKQKICAKMLWRAFQFAFKVYSFAGGQDDRADLLTRELAQEIETDPMHE